MPSYRSEPAVGQTNAGSPYRTQSSPPVTNPVTVKRPNVSQTAPAVRQMPISRNESGERVSRPQSQHSGERKTEAREKPRGETK